MKIKVLTGDRVMVEIPDVSGNTRGRILERWGARTGGKRRQPQVAPGADAADAARPASPTTAPPAATTTESAELPKPKLSKGQKAKKTKELDALRDKVRSMKMSGFEKSEIAVEVKKRMIAVEVKTTLTMRIPIDLLA